MPKLPGPAVLVCALLAAWLAAPPAVADWSQIQQRGSLRVLAVHEDLFFSLEPGTEPGFDREILDGFARLHKLDIEVVRPGSWADMIPWLLDGRGDVIVGGYSITPARRAQIAFTSEVFPSRKVVLTRRPHAVVTSLEQLREQRVGTVQGTSMAEAVATAGVPESRRVYVPSGTLPDALRKGTADAVVLGVEHAIIERRRDPDIQLGVFLGEPGSLAFGVRPADDELRRVLSDYVENIRRTPTWSRLVVKYLGDDAVDVLKRAREP